MVSGFLHILDGLLDKGLYRIMEPHVIALLRENLITSVQTRFWNVGEY